MSDLKIPPTAVTPVVNNAARPEKSGAAQDNAPEKVQRDSKAAASTPAQGVPVSVSKLASHMVESRQASVADVDQKKVDAVRSAIEKKTFKVNAGVIADKMLANAEEMLNRNHH